MKAIFFLLASALLIFGLFKVITSTHNSYSPLDTYISTSISSDSANNASYNEGKHFIDSINHK